MPSVKDKNTINELARVYCTNGRCKQRAMETVGYTKTYAKSYCGKLWEDKRLIAAIHDFERKIVANSPYNAKTAEQELEQARLRAIDLKQVAAEIQATLGKCKLYALLTDNINNTTEQTPDPLTQEEIDKLKADAAAITRANIKISNVSGTG